MVGSGLLALGLCLIWFALPGNLFGMATYDAGVYFAVPLRLVDGVVPYRDFVYVQPPGTALLLAPLALLAKVAGAPTMFLASRLLTALVGSANAGLAAACVRHRGRLAMAVAGVGMAVFPYAAQVEHNLKLEPFLVLGCLAGILVAQRAGARPSAGRLVAAGALLGLAGTMKIWAFFPFLALAACELVRSGRRAGFMVAGAAIGFGVPCLPFFVLAPVTMAREVVLDQLGRGGYDYTAISAPNRLGYLTGVDALLGHPAGLGAVVGAVATVALIVGVVAALVAWHRGSGVWTYADSAVTAAAATSLAGLLAAPGLYVTYSYFTAPLLAGVVGILLAEHRRRRALTRQAAGGTLVARGAVGMPAARSGGPRRLGRLASAGALGALGISMALANLSSSQVLGGGRLAANGSVLEEGPAIAAAIPAGTCVVSDDQSLLIEANRYQAARPGCPSFVDPFGMWLVADHGRGAVGQPPHPARLVAQWHAAFARAGALVLSDLDQLMIPWTPGLRRELASRFRIVLTEPDATVYLRRATSRLGG